MAGEKRDLDGDRRERGIRAAAVAQGLEQVLLADIVAGFEIGYCARDAQHAVPCAGRESEPLGDHACPFEPARAEAAGLDQIAGVQAGVGKRHAIGCGAALGLALPSGHDALAHIG